MPFKLNLSDIDVGDMELVGNNINQFHMDAFDIGLRQVLQSGIYIRSHELGTLDVENLCKKYKIAYNLHRSISDTNCACNLDNSCPYKYDNDEESEDEIAVDTGESTRPKFSYCIRIIDKTITNN